MNGIDKLNETLEKVRAEGRARVREAELVREEAEREHRMAMANVERAKREYVEVCAREKKLGLAAFACLIVATLMMIAFVVMLSVGAELYPRRVALGLTIAYLLLAPWAFWRWLGSLRH